MLGVSILCGCYNLSTLSCEYLCGASIVCSCYYRGSTAVATPRVFRPDIKVSKEKAKHTLSLGQILEVKTRCGHRFLHFIVSMVTTVVIITVTPLSFFAYK